MLSTVGAIADTRTAPPSHQATGPCRSKNIAGTLLGRARLDDRVGALGPRSASPDRAFRYGGGVARVDRDDAEPPAGTWRTSSSPCSARPWTTGRPARASSTRSGWGSVVTAEESPCRSKTITSRGSADSRQQWQEGVGHPDRPQQVDAEDLRRSRRERCPTGATNRRPLIPALLTRTSRPVPDAATTSHAAPDESSLGDVELDNVQVGVRPVDADLGPRPPHRPWCRGRPATRCGRGRPTCGRPRRRGRRVAPVIRTMCFVSVVMHPTVR